MFLTLLTLLRGLFIALHTVFWSVPVLFLTFFDEYGQRAMELVGYWAKGNLWACGVKVRTRGLDQLDPNQPYLLMANHQSQFDILSVVAVMSHFQLRWVGKHELRKIPIFGLCLERTHQILIDRQNKTQTISTIRKVKALLSANISVLFFPEGTRSLDGRMLPFKPGGFAVAVETGVPIVPVTINGGHKLMPSGDWRIRSGEIEIIYNKPIQIDMTLAKKFARQNLLLEVQQAVAQHLPEECQPLFELESPHPVPAGDSGSVPVSDTSAAAPARRTAV